MGKFITFFSVYLLLLLMVLGGLIGNAATARPATANLASDSNIDLIDKGFPAMRSFTTREGLPQNSIMAMAYDRRGYLWVGTQDGAAYYNGRSWTVLNMLDRAVSNVVFSLIAAVDGSIWMGRQDGGLARWQAGSWTIFNRSNGFPSNTVYYLLEDPTADGSSTIWAATANGLARQVNGKWQIIDTNSGLPHNSVRCLLKTTDASGHKIIWVGTVNGLARVDAEKFIVIDTLPNLSGLNIRSLREITNQHGVRTVWIGTKSGLVGVDPLAPNSSQRLELLNSKITDIAATSDRYGHQTLWVSTFGDGLKRFQDGRWISYDSKYLGTEYVNRLLEVQAPDGSNALWVGSSKSLIRLNLQRWIAFNMQSGLPNKGVYSFLETVEPAAGSLFWFGTEGGLACFREGEWKIYNGQSGLGGNSIQSLLASVNPDGSNTIWAGTDKGLAQFVAGKWQHDDVGPLSKSLISCLLETVAADGHRTLWVGSSNGLGRLENGVWTLYDSKSGLPHDQIFSLLATSDADGQLIIWIGTQNGLARFAKGNFTIFNTQSGLPNNLVLGLLETRDANGRATLWIGTSGGVAMIDPAVSAPQFINLATIAPVLPNNVIYQIREDKKHRIYLFTNKGIARLSARAPTADDPRQYSLYTFTTEDGLPSNECTQGGAFVDRNGRIWAGTIDGAAMLDIKQEAEDHIVKPLYIERTWLNGEEQNLSLITPLDYYQNNLTFEFSLLSYFREPDTRYQSQLVGFEKTLSPWSSDSRRVYTNLGEGDYLFQVWGSDYAGNLSGPATIAFHIRPAPWRTWWAYSLYLLVVVGSVYATIKYRLKTFQQRAALLEARVIERTRELAESEAKIRKQAEELKSKNEQLDNKVAELLASHRRADRIFSALAEALPGTILDGKYCLEEKIGVGGFGVVYRARHLALKRAIAVKIFKPAPGNDSADSLARFQLEAISASRINHANAVQVLDSGLSSEGIAYLVMELLEGHTLAQELHAHHQFEIVRVAQILVPLCDLLASAHAAGIIHRDIKPDNIFLHRGETCEVVKVVDFGIAKLRETNGSIELKDLTTSGGLIGTPTYMAPERFDGKSYDGKADVYSVGVLIYRMLGGELPFAGGSIFEIIRQHLTQTPRRLRELNPQLNVEVEAVVLSALSKDPATRPTARELREKFLAAAGIADSEIVARRYLPIVSPVSTINTAEQLTKTTDSTMMRSIDTSARVKRLEGIIQNLLLDGTDQQNDITAEKDPTVNSLMAAKWRRIEEIFYTAIELPPEARHDYLDEACGNDPELRQRVAELLADDAEVNR